MTTGQCESHLNHSLATIVNAEFVRISLIRLSSARFWRRAEGKQDRQVCYERIADLSNNQLVLFYSLFSNINILSGD